MSEPIFITSKRLIMGFGKYPDATVGEVMKEDAQYLCWLQTNVSWFDMHWELFEEALGVYMELEFMFATQGI